MVSLNILVTVPSNSFQFFWWFGGKNVILQAKHLKCKYSNYNHMETRIEDLDAKAGGSRVVMRKVNDDIMNVFRLTGFIDLFEFE